MRNKLDKAYFEVGKSKPTLRAGPQRLETLCTSEGAAPPPNTLAELRRDVACLSFVRQQIQEVETSRFEPI